MPRRKPKKQPSPDPAWWLASFALSLLLGALSLIAPGALVAAALLSLSAGLGVAAILLAPAVTQKITRRTLKWLRGALIPLFMVLAPCAFLALKGPSEQDRPRLVLGAVQAEDAPDLYLSAMQIGSLARVTFGVRVKNQSDYPAADVSGSFELRPVSSFGEAIEDGRSRVESSMDEPIQLAPHQARVIQVIAELPFASEDQARTFVERVNCDICEGGHRAGVRSRTSFSYEDGSGDRKYKKSMAILVTRIAASYSEESRD